MRTNQISKKQEVWNHEAQSKNKWNLTYRSNTKNQQNKKLVKELYEALWMMPAHMAWWSISNCTIIFLISMKIKNFSQSFIIKTIANIILNWEELKASYSFPRSETRQGCLLSPLSSQTLLEVLARAIREEVKQRGSKLEKWKSIYACLQITWCYAWKKPKQSC